MLKRFCIAALAGLLLAVSVPVVYASIDGAITISVGFNDRRTVGINTSANLPVNTTVTSTYTNGSGAGQAGVLYQGALALSSGAYSLNLTGTLTDSYGSAVNLVRVKAIYIKNTGATALTVGNGSNPWVTFLTGTGTLILPPGAWVAAATPDATGWTVTASTAYVLQFAGTGSATFQVVVLGSAT